MQLRLSQLTEIMPSLKRRPSALTKATAYLEYLNAAMAEREINTPERMAAFLAQIAHESAELQFFEELWGPTKWQRHYDPPYRKSRELGNINEGDGFRYRGRGPIQLTGRHNYRICGKDLELDLENNPDLAAQPEHAFRVACWYWHKHRLNELADQGRFEEITRRINSASLGSMARNNYYERALKVLKGASGD